MIATLALILASGSQPTSSAVCTAAAGLALLSGIVLEDSTPVPAAGVYVRLDGHAPDAVSSGRHASSAVPQGGRGVFADSTGRFCFSNLRPGRYTMRLNGILRPGRDSRVNGPGRMEVSIDLERSDSSLVLQYDSWGLSLEEQHARRLQVAALVKARRRWVKARPDHYYFTVSVACDCVGSPILPEIHVDDGVVDLGRSRLAPVTLTTIDSLFERLSAELAGKYRFLDTARYDLRFGFPALFRVNTRGFSPGNWAEWQVTSFSVRKP